MTSLTPSDIEWIKEILPRADTDDVWRRLYDDYKDQESHIRLLRNGRDRAEMGVLGMCARVAQLEAEGKKQSRELAILRGEIAMSSDAWGRAERKVLDACARLPIRIDDEDLFAPPQALAVVVDAEWALRKLTR